MHNRQKNLQWKLNYGYYGKIKEATLHREDAQEQAFGRHGKHPQA